MRNYIVGKVISIKNDQVEIEDNNHGDIFTIIEKDKPNLNIGSISKLYIAAYRTEFEEFDYGFTNNQERDLFKSLVRIKTIGCKTAVLIIETYELNEIIDIIKTGDVDKILYIKGIGAFTAKLIIEDLQKQLFNFKLTNKKEKLLVSLQKLGFKTKDVYQVLRQLDDSLSLDQMVEKAVLSIGQSQL